LTIPVAQEPTRHAERSRLEHGLAEAEQLALDELDLIRGWLTRAVEAASTSQTETADDVKTWAGEAERRYGELHDRLLAVIATQAPVAGDLRLAMALLHVNDRIERMSAQCVNIATLWQVMPDGASPSEEQLRCLSAMADLACEQIEAARESFHERDLVAARALRDHDLGINEHNRRCFALAVSDGDDAGRREAGFIVAMMARAIERIGDNAVDIGQQLEFVVTSRMRGLAVG
jgi:phosphate transport system protein